MALTIKWMTAMKQPQPRLDPTAIAAKVASATDDFLKERLPGWLAAASPEQVNAVRDCWRAHATSQADLHALSARIDSPDTYTVNRLEHFLQTLGVADKLGDLYWRELRRSFRVPVGGALPDDTLYFFHQPALQRLMQNFEPGASFYLGSGLATSDKGPVPVDSQADLVCSEPDVIALFCHEEDIGADYQAHLDLVFDEKAHTTLAKDKRKGLALAAEIAAVKGEISQADLEVLRKMVADAVQPPAPVPGLRVLLFKLLNCTVDGALAFEQCDADGQVLRVLLYLPDAPRRCLYGFNTWSQLNDALTKEVKKAGVDAYLRQRIALKQLPGFLTTLSKRLKDPSPDLEPKGTAPAIDVFVSLAAGQVSRLKEDASLMLVPTEAADHAASEKRVEQMKDAGLLLLNVAGLFVPVVGSLLLAQTVVQVLSETFEGVRDWSRGHRHEAMEHLLGVAETVAVGAAVTAGAGVVARGFTRSTFVDGLVPVNSEGASKRLWSEDLGPYAAQNVPEQTQTLDNGLHSDGQRHWWQHGGTFYEVGQLKGRWRLLHPQREDAYAPLLMFNGERSWRLRFERPLEWQGSALLLSRLWPQAANLDVQQIEHILQVAGIDEEALRGLLVENRPMPVSLRDTLERFDVDAQINSFFTQLEESSTDPGDTPYYAWCLEQIDVDGLGATEQRTEVLAQADRLRGPLFEHFASRYVSAEDGQSVLQRDFPGLPDAYAAHLLQQADDVQRLRLVNEQRLPLALAEQARSLLRLARLTRMCEGLFLTNSYQADTIELAFNLLRKNAKWPGSINLELREGSESGRRLTVLDPRHAVTHVLVWREGGFRLYGPQGYESDLEIAEPVHLPEVLLALLPASDRARLKWEGPEAAQQVRRDLLRWMPADRQQLERMMGWREIKPWFNPGVRLADGRVGYPLSGRGQSRSIAENTLRARIRALYVGFSENEVENYLNLLLQANGSAFDNLLNQEHEYLQLDVALSNWEIDATQQSRLRARRAVAEELRRCWRLQGEAVVDAHGLPQGMRLSLIGAAIHELPELPAHVDFNHVTDLALVNLQLQQLPVSFLQHFGGVRWLNLSSNAFTTLPAGLEQLRDLQALRLNNNRIQMTGLSATQLVSLPRLRTLNLNDNPLGLISLHFHSISQLSELYMRNCSLQTVPSGLIWCAMLEHADLRGNQIATVPEEILQAPRRLRRTLLLEGNALPVAILERLRAPDPVSARPYVSDLRVGREVWVQHPDAGVQQQRRVSWDRIRAEPGSEDFFQLIGELTGTSDFRQAREDLERRVWEVLDAAVDNTALRQELFNLAAVPRTCVDSVASSFSALEVRVFVARAIQRSAAGQAQAARLDLARQLFRLSRVEQIARDDINARMAAGRGVDEVEVSLAYRSGLARELRLPGQPVTMQFQAIAGVGDEQLVEAAQAVRDAENTDALAAYISQLDFWLEYLRSEYGARFDEVEQPFWNRLEALATGEDAEVQAHARQLVSERESAVETLVLDLTREALETHQGDTGGR
ncbi:NEL-type E3 ubiquitin ligase domain-containing protein [Pseudomonas alkylphenolica]|uniref:NEL-type E3 ubiquitin ligase domain-containing protein n=1 Tax=Pseudomonas alkylphenolica TaxID=237609 RepID=UPI0018D78394|nr:NEL-type E3 ubiquitin ligase domain-containing protein [Pseudomonas alkylphenolica]MBH3427458.1 hypothetical protein [Pseudomonas alkylphenolica]